MKLFPLATALVAALLLASCGTPGATGNTATKSAPREPNWISLERTPNAAGVPVGPVYVVTLFEDGRVIFEGHAAVAHQGTHSKTIPRVQARAVFTRFETLNLWDRERRYDVERANRGGDSVIVRTASEEVPWDILRARVHGRLLRIDGLFFAPHDILDFKAFIEKTVGLTDWIGQPAEPAPSSQR